MMNKEAPECIARSGAVFMVLKIKLETHIFNRDLGWDVGLDAVEPARRAAFYVYVSVIIYSHYGTQRLGAVIVALVEKRTYKTLTFSKLISDFVVIGKLKRSIFGVCHVAFCIHSDKSRRDHGIVANRVYMCVKLSVNVATYAHNASFFVLFKQFSDFVAVPVLEIEATA